MKSISLIDPKGRKTILYSVDMNKKFISDIRLERLEEDFEDEGDKIQRKFYVKSDVSKQIILISIMKSQVFVNVATLVGDLFKLASVSTKVTFIETKKTETIEIYYTPTSERKIFVIDLDSGDEVEPEFNITSTGLMKGIINLDIGKKYLALELRDLRARTMIIGACQLLLEDDVLKLNMSKEEVKRINIDKYVELIESGKCVEQKLKDAKVEKERE